jgi:hypothetical protein
MRCAADCHDILFGREIMATVWSLVTICRDQLKQRVLPMQKRNHLPVAGGPDSHDAVSKGRQRPNYAYLRKTPNIQI